MLYLFKTPARKRARRTARSVAGTERASSFLFPNRPITEMITKSHEDDKPLMAVQGRGGRVYYP